MKIAIHEIPRDDTLHVEEELSADFLSLGDFDAEAVSPVSVVLDAGLDGGSFFATGSLTVKVMLVCVACLEPFEATIEVPDFAVQIDVGFGDTADLTDSIREDIVLNLPPYPRCDVDGARTCPATFPTAPGDPISEDSSGNPSAWNVLDDLKPKS